MSFQIRDGISPELARLAHRVADRKPILEAMGLQLVGITKRAFSDPSLRVAAWAPRKSGGTHQLLKKSGALWQSIRITALSNDSVTVGSDRIYAAVHQFGGTPKQNIPARPFFPFKTSNSPMADFAQKKVEAIARAKIQAMLPK